MESTACTKCFSSSSGGLSPAKKGQSRRRSQSFKENYDDAGKQRQFPTHASYSSNIFFHPHEDGPDDGLQLYNYPNSHLSLLETSTFKPSISNHTKYMPGSIPYYYHALKYGKTGGLPLLRGEPNFVVLNQVEENQPIISQIYPSVFTYDFWDVEDNDSTTSGGRSGLIYEPYLGPRRSLGISSLASNRFDNVKHVNNFFMADETRLPIYIAAFGSGFFSVLICLCAVLYLKYLFTNMRNMKAEANKRHNFSKLALLDKQLIVDAKNRENLAEVRAMNPALARIEDYTSGEVKKWDRRVKLAEANNAAGFEEIIKDIVSGDDSDEDDHGDLRSIATSPTEGRNKGLVPMTFKNMEKESSEYSESEDSDSDDEDGSSEENSETEESEDEDTDEEEQKENADKRQLR